MFKRGKVLTGMLLMLISAAFVLGAGFYRSSLNEGASLNFSLPQSAAGKVEPVIADLVGNGLPKKLLQPGL